MYIYTHMGSNQNTVTFSNFNSTSCNLEKMEGNAGNIVHEQIPMGSVWGANCPFQMQQMPFSSSSSSSLLPTSCSGFLNDMLGIHSKEEEEELEDEPEEELGAMKEMIYKIAAMQPVEIDPAAIIKPKRRNVRISDDPQSVAARHRREKISEKIRILQRLVPGGTKMDTASMLDEAIRYVKFLKRQIRLLQSSTHSLHSHPQCIPALGLITNTATTATNAANSGSAPTSSHHWPFAMLQYYTSTIITASSCSSDTTAAAAALGFNAKGEGGPAHHAILASSFNHDQVISD